jgi:hypothetical protein
VQAKQAELEKLRRQGNNSRPLSWVRDSTWVTHVRNRLRRLEDLDPEVMGEFKVGLYRLYSRLDIVESWLSSVCEDEELSHEHLEQAGEVGHVVGGGNVDFRLGLGGPCREDVSLTARVSASDEVTVEGMEN